MTWWQCMHWTMEGKGGDLQFFSVGVKDEGVEE